jgi:hypothetical protein
MLILERIGQETNELKPCLTFVIQVFAFFSENGDSK